MGKPTSSNRTPEVKWNRDARERGSSIDKKFPLVLYDRKSH